MAAETGMSVEDNPYPHGGNAHSDWQAGYLAAKDAEEAGCFRLPDAYAASDLGWSEARVDAARLEAIDAGLMVHDAATDEHFFPDGCNTSRRRTASTCRG